MAKLCINLPPFSPDYSGVASALFDLKPLSILHDASGCTGNYTSYDEPRWYGSTSPVMCSGLREIDAILGDDEKLIKNTIKAANELKVKLISIIGSPVPMVIGTDSIGIAKEIEETTGIPAFGFETTGTRYYDYGMELALESLFNKFIKTKPKTKNPSINIIGANAIDLTELEELETIKRIIKKQNVEICATIPMQCSFETLEQASSAWCNLVISKSAIKLAKQMEEKFNQQYFIQLPLGEIGENRLKIYLNNLRKEQINKNNHKIKEPKILIISEQVKANALRDVINPLKCEVATLFGINEEIMNAIDSNLSCESEIIEKVNDKKYDIVIADPLILNLITDKNKKKIAIPHYAVSSKLYKNEKLNLIGKNCDKFLCSQNL